MAMRNNVTRMLDRLGIAYQALPLPTDEKRSALETAAALGMPPEQVFKTIVLTRPGGGKPVLAVVPGPSEVDLKAAAAALGVKKLTLPTQNEAERLTGLLSGGISALALIDMGCDTLLDEFAGAFDAIIVSGGQRGLGIRIGVAAFIRLTGAAVASFSR